MIQTPAIVTFANQKGGVGKTTLCATFANYLVAKGVRVVVVDCDYQHSIAKCRRADIRKYGNQHIPYNVSEFLPNDKDTMTQLTAKLHNDPSIEIALMDSPGSLNAAGLVPLFCNSDIIVIPFHYDLVTVPTTSNFLMFIDRLRKATGGKMSTRLFIVPNSHDNRVGTRSEQLLWEETRDTFSNYGIVTPKIAKRADMQRFTTMAGLDTQLPFVQNAFDKIYSEIFGNTEPRRKVELTGIQLGANLAKDKSKKANKQEKLQGEDGTETQDAKDTSSEATSTEANSSETTDQEPGNQEENGDKKEAQ